MVVDKSWLDNPNRSSKEYKDGLELFIEMCKAHVDKEGYIFCPCTKCQNSDLLLRVTVKFHLRAWGFFREYKDWTYHGESLIPQVAVVDDVGLGNDMAGVIEDLMEEDSNLDEGNSGTESSGACDDFEDLLKEVQSELYPGCKKFSSLDFLAKLMHIKVKNKWSNSSFDETLELLQSSHPEGNKIPASYYEAKKRLKKIGLGYESIHVCQNDCALFWKEHESWQNCPVCHTSRWVDPKTKGKKVAHKVLRYFPLTPRLRRLYCSRHTAKDMIWHSTGRSEDGTMRHPVDGSSWKEFDIKYPNFSREPRNVRLGLAADGFNPFGNMSSAHSTWPVILTTYNLPPWLCMKESSFMLSLLIPGPKSPGKDMDVFLRPLVDELKHLWQSGVRTKDVATNTFFTNRGGSSTYSSTCYKQSKSRLETFRDAHTLEDGTLDKEAEPTVRQLELEFESQTQTNGANGVNEVEAFEKVLGSRRGWIKGIGFKPSASQAPISLEQPQPQQSLPFTITQEFIDMLFQDPKFKDQLQKFSLSQMGQSSRNEGEEEDDEDEGEDDEDEGDADMC